MELRFLAAGNNKIVVLNYCRKYEGFVFDRGGGECLFIVNVVGACGNSGTGSLRPG